MFSSIEQFRLLTNKRIDGLEKLIAQFNQLIAEFKLKGHDLLDFNNTVFERDFVEFTMHNSGLENAIQQFMESRLSGMGSILKQLELMSKFQKVMVRPALHEDLDNKMLMLFKAYGQELETIEQLYDKYSSSIDVPPELSLILGVGGSAVQYHIKKSLFTSNMPG
jgi:dynein heavy chain